MLKCIGIFMFIGGLRWVHVGTLESRCSYEHTDIKSATIRNCAERDNEDLQASKWNFNSLGWDVFGLDFWSYCQLCYISLQYSWMGTCIFGLCPRFWDTQFGLKLGFCSLYQIWKIWAPTYLSDDAIIDPGVGCMGIIHVCFWVENTHSICVFCCGLDCSAVF